MFVSSLLQTATSQRRLWLQVPQNYSETPSAKVLYRQQIHFFMQGAENYYGQLLPLLFLVHQPLASTARTVSQAEIQALLS